MHRINSKAGQQMLTCKRAAVGLGGGVGGGGGLNMLEGPRGLQLPSVVDPLSMLIER